MSISPIGTRVPTIASNSIIRAGIPLPDNFNATDVAVSLGSLLASVSVSRFDLSISGLEFRNIGAATPLLLIESSRTIIITSAAVVMTEQTEAFNFNAGVSITTTAINTPQVFADNIYQTINGNGLLPIGGDASGSIGQGNAYVVSKDGNEATTGDGFVRIIGTYYEIDL